MTDLVRNEKLSTREFDVYQLPSRNGLIWLYHDGNRLVIHRADCPPDFKHAIRATLHQDDLAVLGEALIELGKEPGA